VEAWWIGGAERVVGLWQPGKWSEGRVGSTPMLVVRTMEAGAGFGLTVKYRDVASEQTGGSRADRHAYAPSELWRKCQRPFRQGEKVWGEEAWAARPASL